MDVSSLLVFAAIFAIACGSPGPTTAALVARVVANGLGGAPSFCLGLLLGDLVWLACAVFGLAALAQVFHPVFLVIKYLGAAYLLFLAWKLWTAPAVLPTATGLAKGKASKLFFGGLALALGNPKTMLFYVALLPTVVELSSMVWFDVVALAIVVMVVYCFVLCGYVALADRARRFIRNTRAMRLVNRGAGTVMAGAAVVVATRN